MSLPITIRLDLRATAKLVVFATNLGFIGNSSLLALTTPRKPRNRSLVMMRMIAISLFFLGGHAALAASSVIVDDKDVADAIAATCLCGTYVRPMPTPVDISPVPSTLAT